MRNALAGLLAIVVMTGSLRARADPLPHFSIATADGTELNETELKGHALLLWYDASDTVRVNDGAKAEFARVLAGVAKQVRPRLVAVGDVASFDYWPARNFAKRELRKYEALYAIAIYGDWTGTLRNALQLKRGDSNLLFIDATGVVRYRGTGKISAIDIQRVSALLREVQ